MRRMQGIGSPFGTAMDSTPACRAVVFVMPMRVCANVSRSVVWEVER